MEKLLTVVQLSAYRYVYQYVSIYVPVLGTRTVLDLASYSSTPGSSTSNPSTNLSAATRLLQRQHGGPELFTNSTLDSSDGSKFPEPRHTCGLLSLYCVPSTQLGTFAVGQIRFVFQTISIMISTCKTRYSRTGTGTVQVASAARIVAEILSIDSKPADEPSPRRIRGEMVVPGYI
jgi:hypothetical protein